jgi:hypothetical protein
MGQRVHASMTVPQLPALPSPPLATDAATATAPAGACRICARAILRGERYARLVPSRRLAHVACVGRMAAPQRAVPVIR